MSKAPTIHELAQELGRLGGLASAKARRDRENLRKGREKPEDPASVKIESSEKENRSGNELETRDRS